MRKALFIILFSFTGIMGFAQTGVKIYGYVRDILPGNIPKGHNAPKQNTATYWIYISGSPKNPITPVELWINGENFSAKSEGDVKTPVLVPEDNTGKQISLVAKTSNKVQKIGIVQPADGKTSSEAKKKAETNDLVVVYKLKGKIYTATLKKLTRLEALSSE
jgi:hypothetical protein